MYCGIDVAKNKSQVCIINKDKGVIAEFEIGHTKDGFEKLEKHLTKESKIGMEVTGTYSNALYTFLKKKYKVTYIDSLQMRRFSELHYSHIKNDKVDAKLIANYLTFDFKTLDVTETTELKDLVRLYQKTVKQMTRYKFMFKSQLATIFPEIDKNFHTNKAKGLANILLKYPSPKQIAQLRVEEIHSTLHGDLKTGEKYSIKYAEKLKKLAEESIGVPDYPVTCFQYTTKLMIFYQDLVNEIRKKMKKNLLKTPYSKLLEEVGYKDVGLSIIVGEIGDIRRFPNHKKFVRFCGLDVSEKQSGKSMSVNCFITKSGNSNLRGLFYNLVLSNLAHKREISKFFYRLKESGKHPKKCMVATARKLAVKAYYDMMRCHDNLPNSPSPQLLNNSHLNKGGNGDVIITN